MKIIALAGGSGSGKTTVSNKLLEMHPDIYEIVSLDRYQMSKDHPEIPKIEDYINWDHPNVILWKEVVNLISIKRNNINSSNKVVILDGYLGLYNDELNSLFDLKFYLDLNEKDRNIRRMLARGGQENKSGQKGYIKNVLNPMHNKYLEPTKKNADYIINTKNKNSDVVAKMIHSIIFSNE